MSNEYEAAIRTVSEWRLGQTSQRYESSGSGAETISTGKGDRGGVSYGAYQLSSKIGTLQEYLAQSSYGAKFDGMHPATPEFDAKWRELARTDPGFGADQHDFIGRTHYRKQLVRLEAMGLPLTDRGRAVQDALWSTSVQFRDLTSTIVSCGLKEKFGSDIELSKLTDRQIVEAVQDYKVSHNNNLFKSSSALWPGLLKRAHSETATLLQLADQETLVHAQPIGTATVASNQQGAEQHQGRRVHGIQVLTDTTLHPGDHNPQVQSLQQLLSRLGYRDPNGHPLAADGDFGRNTEHAVRAFQRDHGLQVDGVAGLATFAVVDAIQANPFTSRHHPHHALYEQSLRQVHAEESRRQIQHGPHSEVLAGALTVEATRHGMTRIDRVELNDTGTLVRAVQVSPLRDEPGLNRTTDPITTQQATHTPLSQSSEQARQAVAGRQPHQEAERHVQSQPAPSLGM
jgi:hypothetical protein